VHRCRSTDLTLETLHLREMDMTHAKSAFWGVKLPGAIIRAIMHDNLCEIFTTTLHSENGLIRKSLYQ
jgi:hypothetical protein